MSEDLGGRGHSESLGRQGGASQINFGKLRYKSLTLSRIDSEEDRATQIRQTRFCLHIDIKGNTGQMKK